MSGYLNYLQESTDVVKSRNKLSKLILIAVYLVIWGISLIVFWFFTSGSDAMGFGVMFLWILLPVTTFVLSLLIGYHGYWGCGKWIATAVLGGMYMLAEYATFGAANMAAFEKLNAPQPGMALAGAVISIAGLGIGAGVRCLKSRLKNSR